MTAGDELKRRRMRAAALGAVLAADLTPGELRAWVAAGSPGLGRIQHGEAVCPRTWLAKYRATAPP